MVGFNNDGEDKIMSKLKQNLGPEFVNRIYKFIVFNRLTKKDISKIVNNHIKTLKERFNKVNIKIDGNVINEIVELSNYKDFGARKIEKIVEDKLEGIIIDKIMQGDTEIIIKTIKEYA
jgi:ATP-dependent Clp protease ATP-binding subunit ClpC